MICTKISMVILCNSHSDNAFRVSRYLRFVLENYVQFFMCRDRRGDNLCNILHLWSPWFNWIPFDQCTFRRVRLLCITDLGRVFRMRGNTVDFRYCDNKCAHALTSVLTSLNILRPGLDLNPA